MYTVQRVLVALTLLLTLGLAACGGGGTATFVPDNTLQPDPSAGSSGLPDPAASDMGAEPTLGAEPTVSY